jgi:hypothetical protein
VEHRSRPKKSITLAQDLMTKLEAEADIASVPVSQVIESHLREHYQVNVFQSLQHLESSLNEFKAAVMPVVVKVAGMIREWEQRDEVSSHDTPAPKPKIATYEEMYGPIRHTPVPQSPPRAPAEPPPRRRWPWGG